MLTALIGLPFWLDRLIILCLPPVDLSSFRPGKNILPESYRTWAVTTSRGVDVVVVYAHFAELVHIEGCGRDVRAPRGLSLLSYKELTLIRRFTPQLLSAP